jgi:hypothetical protein
MDIVNLLLNPQLIAILGPAGIILLVGCWLLYRNYSQVLKDYKEVQEKRIQENQNMQKVYYELANDVDKTLEILLATLGRKNGNGGSDGGSKNV